MWAVSAAGGGVSTALVMRPVCDEPKGRKSVPAFLRTAHLLR
jgi:hypothetical protein